VQKEVIISLVSATLFTGISVYCVLWYLLIPMKFTLPICITMASLSFGLTRYYCTQYDKNIGAQSETNDFGGSSGDSSVENEKNIHGRTSNITFVLVYSILLVVCSFSIPRLDVVYTSWNLLDITNIIELASGIMLCFFMPGYAMITLLIYSYRANPLVKILLGYLCSMLITGLTVYFLAIYFDTNINQIKFLLISVYLAILVAFVVYYRIYRIIFSTDSNIHRLFHQFVAYIGNIFQTILRSNLSEFVVFTSLFALLIISTYYLYGGVTIGDQWYHQNRAIYFMYGNFKELVISNGDQTYTPLLSSLLAGLTSISGVPLVNSYASIAFLNMTAVFAFYYFCRTWFPSSKKRAALFASSLFVIASGFGWMYILHLAGTNPVESQINSISYFVEEKMRVSDIRLSANFMIAAFPDFSTGLTLVSLPAGFVLLGLVYVKFRNKFSYITILSLISILGILFHDEFYIFIIVSSLLPLIYNLKKKSYVYFAFLIALASAYIIDGMLPIKYFTSNKVFGISVIELNVIFTLVTLSLYLLRQNWHRYFSFISIPSFQFKIKLTSFKFKIHFIPKIVLVSIVVYISTLCFIVWSQLPANYVDVHTQGYNTPWYLHPMRLGLVGLIGIAYILSYLFKRFERETFVFGIIITIALFAGPYYNEQRFNKYVMVGMIGFASLLIFQLLNFIANKKPVLNGVIIGSIVIIAGLSTIMYIGYNGLVIESQDYTHALGRRNFPSLNELSVLDFMRSKVQDGSNHNNIATFPNEYNFREGGIISKLHAFSGLPLRKAIQTQYIINASTLESFYHLLELSNTGYIMIPTNTINQSTLTDPIQFALKNFQQIHKNDDYLVLKVPSVRGPSTSHQGKVGIIYEKDKSLSSTVSDKKILQVDNRTFHFEKDTKKFMQVQKENQTEKVILYGYKKNGGKTFWSRDLGREGINYIESSLRALNETKTGKGNSGIKWSDGNRTYFVSLSDKGLQLREQTTNDDKTLLLAQNSQVENDVGIWYLLKIAILNNSINVYVDNVLKAKVQRNLPEKDGLGVSKFGINSENNVVEFGPIQIGKIELPQEDYDLRNSKYSYPLTSLALASSEYSSYVDDDQSIFSNNVIILPFDRQDLNDELFNHLLNYTKSGGTLVVINSDDKYEGRFSRLFSIEPIVNNTEEFSRIASDDEHEVMLNVSGTLKHIKIKPFPDSKVIASYRKNDSRAIVPFAIEKHISEKGRIIYINGVGYFDAIFSNPKKYFLSLGNLSDLFESDHNRTIIEKNVSEPIKRFIGDVRMVGKITINGSSFLMDSNSNSSNVHVKNISIADRYGNLKNRFENLSIIDVKPSGRYEILINSTGKLMLPSTDSQHDYVEMSLPNNFNMTIKLLNDKNTYLEIMTNNSNSSINTIRVNNGSKIDFYKVRTESPILEVVPVLLKSPEIIVNGNIRFDKTNFYGQEIDEYTPLNVSGQVKAKFDLIDDFKEPFRNGTKIQYLSYLGLLSVDGKRNQFKQGFELPGDISSDIKKRGLDVPLISILSTSTNFIAITAIFVATITAIWLIRRMHVYR
jgi:hypothetical protein